MDTPSLSDAHTAITVLIPLLNEEESLRALYDQLTAMANKSQLELQIIFVDDGSNDGSWKIIESLAKADTRVTGIRFRRNFGKAAALAAGIQKSVHPIIVTMDADLQDDPNEVPNLVAKLAQGYDCVSGWKKNRLDPWHKRWPSKVFNWMVGKISGLVLHDHNCGLKAYRREVFQEVHLYGEMHRFIPVLAAARGFRVTEIPVLHHARKFGSSKYGWSRLPKGLLDIFTVCFLTEYRQRPLHLLGSLGMICFAFGSIVLTWLTAAWIVTRTFSNLDPIHLHERAVFYYAIVSLIIGIQLIVMGVLAELIIATNRRSAIPFSISQSTDSTTPDSSRRD